MQLFFRRPQILWERTLSQNCDWGGRLNIGFFFINLTKFESNSISADQVIYRGAYTCGQGPKWRIRLSIESIQKPGETCLFRADQDQFRRRVRTPQPRGKSRNCPRKGPFSIGPTGTFRAKPRFLSPRLDFPEMFILAWKMKSWASEFPHQKIGVWWAARLKFSTTLESFNPGGRSWNFSIFGPLCSRVGRLTNGYFVNGHLEFQCAKKTHNFQRIGMSPVFVRGVQPFLSLSLPFWWPSGHFPRILKVPVCKVPVCKVPVCEPMKVVSEQLSEFRKKVLGMPIQFSECQIQFSECHFTVRATLKTLTSFNKESSAVFPWWW